LALQFVREHLCLLRWRISLKLALIPQHLKAKLTLLLHTLVLKELVEAAAAKLLPVLEQAEGAEVPGLPGVDGAPLHVPLAVAQRRPAFHPLPSTPRMDPILADVAQHLDVLVGHLSTSLSYLHLGLTPA